MWRRSKRVHLRFEFGDAVARGLDAGVDLLGGVAGRDVLGTVPCSRDHLDRDGAVDAQVAGLEVMGSVSFASNASNASNASGASWSEAYSPDEPFAARTAGTAGVNRRRDSCAW